ncbi:hypothetical protein JHK87_047175 [Glycine soja]|nr:hypothetical protein JHK87_047175 [Glycine soja]
MLMVGGRDRSGAGKVAPGRRPRSALHTRGYGSALFWVPLVTEIETICGKHGFGPVDLEGQRWSASSRR